MANDDREQELRRYKAQRIAEARRIFGERRKLLAALFPTNGDALVARACAVACVQVNADALMNAAVDMICERVIACHHLGLEVGDQAYLVPYKGQTNLIIGPRGLIALAYRSGFVKSVYATSVFRADVEAGLFKYNLATGEIQHEKAQINRRTGGRPEELIAYTYCVIDTTTGGRVLDVLTAEDLGYYRSFSKATKGPWIDNYEGMCRKTAIKRGLEFVPRSPLMAAALKETDEGGYEIPDDMWEQAKEHAARLAGSQTSAAPEQIVMTDAQRAAAIDGGREPGSDR